MTGCIVTQATINYIVELRCDSLLRNARDDKLTGCTANDIGFALDFRIAKIHWNVLLEIGQDMELSCCRRSYLVLTTISLATYSVLLFKWERIDIIRGEQKLLERVVCTYKRQTIGHSSMHIS